MNRFFVLSTLIVLSLLSFNVEAEEYHNASTIRTDLLNTSYDGIFVAANGGDAHACSPNSREALIKAIEKRAQIVVISLKMCGKEVYLDDTSAMFTLKEALEMCSGKILVAIANPEPYIKTIRDLTIKTKTTQQIILYGCDEPIDGFLNIPIINLENADPITNLEKILVTCPVAVELNFTQDNSPNLYKAINLIKEAHSRVMFNTTRLGLCGTFVDPSSPVEDINLVYDPLFNMGASIILTDGIKPLLNMLHPGSIPILPKGAIPMKVEMPTLYSEAINQPDSVFAVTQVFGDGIKLTGIALLYPHSITTEDLGKAEFSVKGRTITSVSITNEINMTNDSGEGRYIIIHLSPNDKNASLKASFKGNFKKEDNNKPMSPKNDNGIPPIPIVKEPFVKAFAEVTLPSGQIVITQKQINLIVDEFQQKSFIDPLTDLTLNYNIYIPSRLPDDEKVPLVLFMEDASCVGPYVPTPLMQGLGAVIWASPEDQAKRPCIVVAPQYPEVTVDDAGYTSPLVDVTARLIEELTKTYPVDTKRIYTTGQSMGGMMSIVLLIRYPHLFASAYLVACQWVIDQTLPLSQYHYWQMVSANDFIAFPWQNLIMEGLEKQGVKINRGLWNAKWDANMWQFMYDDITSRPAQIYYTVFAPGTVFTQGEFEGGASGHMATWRYAYNIEPIRKWLFEQ